MSNKNFVIKKTTPNDVLFILHPIDNIQLSKTIHLTKRIPQQVLPENWALGVFFDAEIYNMFRKGLFTFDNNDELVKAAVEQHVYFDNQLDFTPASEADVPTILATLKAGNRQNIINCIAKYGEGKVKEVAISNADSLSVAVAKMVENIFKIQLNLNED